MSTPMKRKSTRQMRQIDLFEGTVGDVRPPAIRAFLGDELVVDNFAGGGGASSGIAAAIGRDPDIAINHDPEAIAMHEANHPHTEHYLESVWDVDPAKATRGRPVALAWFSPDCKHHSKAKGGKPREQKIRGLAWVAVRWARAARPRIIALENVEEFQDWGPLYKQHTHGCKGAARVCRKSCRFGKPIPERKGETFRAFVRKLERIGYVVEWRQLRACDYGAPTTRRRLFLVARCDGRPIAWPQPTHGPRAERPHRAAAECIDWSIPCPSIFDRPRALKRPTMARVARGCNAFVLQSPRPFIVTMRGTEGTHIASSARDAAEPLRTVSAGGSHHAVVIPYLVHRSNGERPGQAPRIYDPLKPIGTIVAQGQKHALIAAFLVKHYGGNESATGGAPLDGPTATITARDHHSLGAAFLVRWNRTGFAQPVDDPIGTLTTRERFGLVESELAAQPLTAEQDRKARRVAAFLREHGYDVGEYATVVVGGVEYVVVDLLMRMLVPRELFLANGFRDGYVIAPVGPKGKPLTKTAQIRMCGNSVPPPLATAIARAQLEAAPAPLARAA